MEIHGTVYYESQRPPEVPAFVKNHGLLPQPEFQQLLRKAKVRLWDLWPLSPAPRRPQLWMMGIHQAGHFHVLCRPESWQTRRYPTAWAALHWEGLGEWELYRPALPSPSQSWSNCKSCREAVTQAEETLSRSPWGHSFWRAASTSSQSWISAATTGSLGMSLWLALEYHLRPESLPLASSPSWSFLRSL